MCCCLKTEISALLGEFGIQCSLKFVPLGSSVGLWYINPLVLLQTCLYCDMLQTKWINSTNHNPWTWPSELFEVNICFPERSTVNQEGKGTVIYFHQAVHPLNIESHWEPWQVYVLMFCKWSLSVLDSYVDRLFQQKIFLLAEVSHDDTNWNEKRETSVGFRRVLWWSRRPNFWSKFTGFQNWFHLVCNARALLDCTLTVIEPTVDYGFQEIREFWNFSLWS